MTVQEIRGAATSTAGEAVVAYDGGGIAGPHGVDDVRSYTCLLSTPIRLYWKPTHGGADEAPPTLVDLGTTPEACYFWPSTIGARPRRRQSTQPNQAQFYDWAEEFPERLIAWIGENEDDAPLAVWLDALESLEAAEGTEAVYSTLLRYLASERVSVRHSAVRAAASHVSSGGVLQKLQQIAQNDAEVRWVREDADFAIKG